jgi:hypothetical protein
METMPAEWRPGWYELDQGIEVGLRAQFAFFPPGTHDGNGPLVFYNTLWRPEEAVAARGTIARIVHPVLGAVQKVDTQGLDYTFVLADGRRFVVDAEEEPGQLFEESAQGWRRVTPPVESWTLFVDITDLTPLEQAPARLDQS